MTFNAAAQGLPGVEVLPFSANDCTDSRMNLYLMNDESIQNVSTNFNLSVAESVSYAKATNPSIVSTSINKSLLSHPVSNTNSSASLLQNTKSDASHPKSSDKVNSSVDNQQVNVQPLHRSSLLSGVAASVLGYDVKSSTRRLPSLKTIIIWPSGRQPSSHVWSLSGTEFRP
jgi:hypothetical protein